MTLTFVLGGARSGKSRYAQQAAEAAGEANKCIMIATAEAHDAEMANRIARHRQERGARWETVEAPRELPAAIRGLSADDVAVVDCLTLWVSNLMMQGQVVDAGADRLVESLTNHAARIWVVSNEVGMGIVPENALARRFRDDIGRLHQRIAAMADHVVLVVAGIPMIVK